MKLPIKENHIGLVVSEILLYTHTDPVTLKMIKVPPQIMTTNDRLANERPVYTVIDQW